MTVAITFALQTALCDQIEPAIELFRQLRNIANRRVDRLNRIVPIREVKSLRRRRMNCISPLAPLAIPDRT